MTGVGTIFSAFSYLEIIFGSLVTLLETCPTGYIIFEIWVFTLATISIHLLLLEFGHVRWDFCGQGWFVRFLLAWPTSGNDLLWLHHFTRQFSNSVMKCNYQVSCKHYDCLQVQKLCLGCWTLSSPFYIRYPTHIINICWEKDNRFVAVPFAANDVFRVMEITCTPGRFFFFNFVLVFVYSKTFTHKRKKVTAIISILQFVRPEEIQKLNLK